MKKRFIPYLLAAFLLPIMFTSCLSYLISQKIKEKNEAKLEVDQFPLQNYYIGEIFNTNGTSFLYKEEGGDGFKSIDNKNIKYSVRYLDQDGWTEDEDYSKKAFNKEGKCKATFGYYEDDTLVASTFIYVWVTRADISNIFISQLPKKINYIYGEKLDLTGLVVKARANKDGKEKVINNWTSSIPDGTEINRNGDIPITISFANRSTSFNVTADGAPVSSIYISKNPTKLNYKYGEKLDLKGLVVKARFIDNSEKEITNYTTSPSIDQILTTTGTVNVIIQYQNETTQFSIKVGEKPIDKEYWGTWIRMDTGDEYYIDSEKIYLTSTKREIQKGITGYYLESENILCNGNYRYFRKGGSARDFSISVSGFNDSPSRAITSITDDKYKLKRTNTTNPEDTQTVSPDNSGKVFYTGSIADDTQKLSVVTGLDNSVYETSATYSISVVPAYNGEDLGTFPIVEEGMYGFKVTHSINADEQGFLFGNYYSSYNLTLDINNIGSEKCATSRYDIYTDDPNLEFTSGDLSGNFSSIEPGKSKQVKLTVCYGKLEEEFIDVPIKISVQDSKYMRTWNDSVTLRFYKGLVSLKVNSRNFDSNSSAKLNGFVIYPDGRSKRFTVSANNITTIQIPWSESDYHLAFSGASASNEMAYSFGFSKTTSLADLSGIWSISDINSYEPNNIFKSAYKINNIYSPAKSYLMDGDIDYYAINNSEIDIKFEPVVIASNIISDDISSNDFNNGDKVINPGELISMDVRVNNQTKKAITGLNAVLSTTSNYITINNSTKNYGDIDGNYFKTLYGAYEYANNSSYKNGYSSNSDYFSSMLEASYGWQFAVDVNTPDNTTIPFTITFTDSQGNSWTDNFNIKVTKTDVNIQPVMCYYNDAKSISSSNNGDDGYNAGETINWDIRVKNTGTTKAVNVIAKLSSTSPYITFSDNICNYGTINSMCYKTSYTASNSTGYTSENSASVSTQNYPGYVFTISADTPNNTVIPILLTITDNQNHTWTTSYNITIVEPRYELSFSNYAISDKLTTGKMNDNDGIIEAGEQIFMNVCIKNTGTSRADNITVSFSSDSEYVTFSTSSRNYGGNLSAGKYKAYNIDISTNMITEMYPDSKYACSFTVDNSTPSGTVIPILITMKNGNDTFYHTLDITVQ